MEMSPKLCRLLKFLTMALSANKRCSVLPNAQLKMHSPLVSTADSSENEVWIKPVDPQKPLMFRSIEGLKQKGGDFCKKKHLAEGKSLKSSIVYCEGG